MGARLPWRSPCSALFRPTLDRQRVRRACVERAASESAAKDAFLATMAWGYGSVGYGAWRVAQAFKDRDAGRKLLDVVVALNSHGPQAAYRLMAGASRLHRIGPAFGTKFLYFADSGDHDRRALILDALVAEWLRRNTNFRVHPVPWAPARYDEYLEKMHDWAKALESTQMLWSLRYSRRCPSAGATNGPKQANRGTCDVQQAAD